MDREELLEKVSTTLIWEVISEKVEDVSQVAIMLQDIQYLDDKEKILEQVTMCEILDSEDFIIKKYASAGGKLIVDFEMPFVLSAWTEKNQLLRITATAIGQCSIPDIDEYDWDDIELEDMSKAELLSKSSLVEILEQSYIDTECDDVSILS